MDFERRVLFPAAGGAGQQAVSRLDPLDDPFIVGSRPKPDAVAGGDDAALVDGQGAEQTADATTENSPIVAAYVAEQAMDAQDSAG